MLFIHIKQINCSCNYISPEQPTVWQSGLYVRCGKAGIKSLKQAGLSLIPAFHFPMQRAIGYACVVQICTLCGGAEPHPLMFKFCGKQISVSGTEIAGKLHQLQQICSLPQKAYGVLENAYVK